MAMWSKLKSELDRAGRAAQGAIDDGKLRLEIHRARQLVDAAAQALGHAVYRDATGLSALDPETKERLVTAIREREAEVARLAVLIKERKATDKEEPASS